MLPDYAGVVLDVEGTTSSIAFVYEVQPCHLSRPPDMIACGRDR